MIVFKNCREFFRIILAMLLSAVLLTIAGCTGPAERSSQIAEAEKDPTARVRIGLLLETLKEERWNRDKDLFVQKANELGADVEVQVADGNDTVQLQQAENLLTKGVDVLVVVPRNGVVAAAIADAADRMNVPVIAYDRLIMNSDVALYVSFDNVRVGEMQASYLLERAPRGNYLLICGSPTDNNAKLFYEGQMKVLRPAVERGEIKIVGEQWATNWQASEALRHTENALTQNNNDIVAVVAAADSVSLGVVQALENRGLAGKVLVTGQDADLAASRNIAAGKQTMTIYKPIKPLATIAAESALKLARGERVETSRTINNGRREVPSVFLDPITVDRENLRDTVIRDGYQKAEDVYGKTRRQRMKAKAFSVFLFCFLTLAVRVAGQKGSVTPPMPYGAVPSERQLRWHEMEMYGLVHFGLNTFQGKEWGYGDADPKIFAPSNFDAGQIVLTAKTGGLKGLILVAKHHDGFALWPTDTTGYNISKAAWRGGKGDMVREFQQAAAKHGLKFGVYCSPWDRNSKAYGTAEYVKIYRAQLRELYTRYGRLFISWHDGANGGDGFYGGARETRKIDRRSYYEWDTTFAMTRELQPGAVIFSDVGPDVRWVGNEQGFAAETSWATNTPTAPDGKGEPAPGHVSIESLSSGTRDGRYWMPAECDVPLRPGWFYHAEQDAEVKTPAQLFDLYFKCVGRGGSIDLGLAPDTRGLMYETDVKTLKEFGEMLRKTFSVNLAKGATVRASNVRGNALRGFGPKNILDDESYSYWATDDGVTTAEVEIELASEKGFNIVRLRENIMLGQRIEAFAIDAWQNGRWNEIAAASSIGANRLIRLSERLKTRKVRLRITSSPVAIALSDFGLFAEPSIGQRRDR